MQQTSRAKAPTQLQRSDGTSKLAPPYALLIVTLVVLRTVLASAQAPVVQPGQQAAHASQSASSTSGSRLCIRCIRAHMEFLASDALRGRGSGTSDELVAATYVASQLEAYGIEPAGDDGGFLQRATIVRRKFTAAPQLQAAVSGTPGAEKTASPWIYGRDFLTLQLAQPQFSGALQKISADDNGAEVKRGAFVLVTSKDKEKDKFDLRQAAVGALADGAVAAMVAFPDEPEIFTFGAELPTLPPGLEGESLRRMGGSSTLLELSAGAASAIEKLPDGTELRFSGSTTLERSHTWNALGKLRGSDAKARDSVVVLSAHLDHLGVGPSVDGDNIYNGADDDASGTTAVLELARVLASRPRPRRTVIFALFGSEESGGLGSTYFSEHPPLPLADFAVDLEFEMIGRRDPAIPDDDVWLTGWERSDLGPTLQVHGAAITADPHPEQNFFARSDNYVLAKQGVVAQTIGSYGLHADYHQPSDDLAHIDFKHMNAVIGGLLGPIEWLVNSDFTPSWKKDGRP